MSASPIDVAAKPQERSFWIAVICGALILTIGIGARQSFGIFQKPIAADLGVGREIWSFANALALLLMGGLSPFVGNISDRFGTARTVAAVAHFMSSACSMIAFATESVMLTFGNVLCGDRYVGRGVRPDLRLDHPTDSARETLDRAWRRDGRWIVWSIRYRAIRVAAAVPIG